ncbi:MAG: hypothetical protein ACRC3B_11465 [Bacteroidia bacterium]
MNFNFTCSAATLVNSAQQQVTSHGGTFNGNTSSGSFSAPIPVFGTLAGTYTISGQTLTVTITQESFFLPCSTIQSAIQNAVNAIDSQNA